MKKSTLIATLATRLQCSKVDALEFYEVLRSVMVAQISQDDEFVMHGVGTFKVVYRQARKGRNPRTGAALVIQARKAVRFKPTNALMMQLNPDHKTRLQ